MKGTYRDLKKVITKVNVPRGHKQILFDVCNEYTTGHYTFHHQFKNEKEFIQALSSEHYVDNLGIFRILPTVRERKKYYDTLRKKQGEEIECHCEKCDTRKNYDYISSFDYENTLAEKGFKRIWDNLSIFQKWVLVSSIFPHQDKDSV